MASRLKKIVLTAASKTRSGAADNVSLIGTGRWEAEKIALNFGGRIQTLHADVLPGAGRIVPGRPGRAGCFGQIPVHIGEGDAAPVSRMVASAAPMAAPAKTPAAPATDSRALVVEIKPLEIERILYRGCELSAAKADFRFENGAALLTLTQGKLAGGRGGRHRPHQHRQAGADLRLGSRAEAGGFQIPPGGLGGA